MSGGNSRVLGDWPLSTTRPVGSRTRALRSTVTRKLNFSSATQGSVSDPFLTRPSLMTESICGVVTQAT